MPAFRPKVIFFIVILSFFCLGMGSTRPKQPDPNPPGNPLAPGNGISAVSANASNFSANFDPAKAADSNVSTYWQGASSTSTWWLSLDLGNNYTLTNFCIWWSTDYIPYNYIIQGSKDNLNWTDIVKMNGSFRFRLFSGNKTKAVQKDHTVWGSWRYLRVYITNAKGGKPPIIYETRAYGQPYTSTLKINSLSPADHSSFIAGDVINITVNAESQNKGALQYRYSLDSKVIKDWSQAASFTVTAQDPGKRTLLVDVKDAQSDVVSKTAEVYFFRKFPKPN